MFGFFRKRRMVVAAVIVSAVMGFVSSAKSQNLTEVMRSVKNSGVLLELRVAKKNSGVLVDAEKKGYSVIDSIKDSAFVYVDKGDPESAFRSCLLLKNFLDKYKFFDDLNLRAPVRDVIFRLYKKTKMDRAGGDWVLASRDLDVLIKICRLIGANHFESKFLKEFEDVKRLALK